MIIYKATNKHNGKCYIGQTVFTLSERRSQHLREARSGKGFRFHAAIRKYGEDAFIWEVIDEANDPIVLSQLEGYWIEFYGSYENGYNSTRGDLNPMLFEDIKHKHDKIMRSQAVRKKISDTMKRKVSNGELFGPEHRLHISQSMKGNQNGKITAEIRELGQKALRKSVTVYSQTEGRLRTFPSIKEGIDWWKCQPSYTLSHNRECLYEYVKRSIDKGVVICGVYWKLER